MSKITDVLLKEGLTTLAAIQLAKEAESRTGAQPETLLCMMGLIDEEALLEGIRKSTKIPIVDRKLLQKVPSEVLRKLPTGWMVENRVLPLKIAGKLSYWAMVRPNSKLRDRLARQTKTEVRVNIVPETWFFEAAERYFNFSPPKVRKVEISHGLVPLTKEEAETADFGELTDPDEFYSMFDANGSAWSDSSQQAHQQAPQPVPQAPPSPTPTPQPVAPTPVEPAPAPQPVAQAPLEPAPAPQPVAQAPVEPAPAPQPVAQAPVEPAPAPQPVAQAPVEPAPAPQPAPSAPVEPVPAPQPVAQAPATPTPVPQTPVEAIEPSEAAALSESVKDKDELARLYCRAGLKYFQRAMIFVVKEGMIFGWDGLGPNLDRPRVEAIMIPLGSPSIFQSVCDTTASYIGPVEPTPINGRFYKAVGTEAPKSALVIPVALGNKIINLFYCDNGPVDAPEGAASDLQIMTAGASRVYHRLISEAKKKAQASGAQ